MVESNSGLGLNMNVARAETPATCCPVRLSGIVLNMNEVILEGQCAIVTGAGRGIGRSIAVSLAEAGASVVLTARSDVELESVRSEIAATGGEAACISADLGNEAEVVAVIQHAVKSFGRIDILVNNAGSGVFGPLEECASEDWDRIMAVNARGPFLLCREAIPHLRLHGLSYIVNIGSVVSVKGYENQAAYSASKHALLGMSKALAREVQKDNIRVHVICPGGVATRMVSDARPDLDPAVLMQPGDIADIVLFLVTRRGNAVIDEIHVRRASSVPWA